VDGLNKIPWWAWLIVAALLSLATAHLPYGYYTFLRIVVFRFAAIVAFVGWEVGAASRRWSLVFIAIAILFNPLVPIYLHQATWFYFDLIAALLIFAHLLSKRVSWKKPD
jgi:hypothetical protein